MFIAQRATVQGRRCMVPGQTPGSVELHDSVAGGPVTPQAVTLRPNRVSTEGGRL